MAMKNWFRRTITAFAAIGIALAVGAPNATAAPEAPAQLVHRVTSSSNPKATYDSLSADQKAIVLSEFTKATFKPAPSAVVGKAGVTPMSFGGCWSRALQGTFYGGVTGGAMFTVGQTTQVCVSGGSVYSVAVLGPYAYSNGYPFLSIASLTTGTNNVGWEGRGVAVGTAVIGAGGWNLTYKTLCIQLRLNANGYNYLGFQQCAL